MNHNFRASSCPEQVYSLVALKGTISLKELYQRIPKFSHTSIRRSLYSLRDEYLVEKTDDGTEWKTII